MDPDGTIRFWWEKPWEQAAPQDPAPTRWINLDRWNYDDIFQSKPQQEPAIPTTTCIPAVITGYDKSSGLYVVTAYPYGLSGKSYDVKSVKILQIAQDMTMPPNTWVFLSKTRSQDGKTSSFYAQPPVWLP